MKTNRKFYPLVPVISGDSEFAKMYDQHFMSSYFLSSCLSLKETVDLSGDGARFDSIIWLKDSKTNKHSKMFETFQNKYEIVAIDYSYTHPETISYIHETIKINKIRNGMG